MENYYEILQVSSKATKEIIDKAYKTLAKTYHPDANPPEKKEWAEEQFKKINAAYEVISDEEKRKKYDEELNRSQENIARQMEERYQKLQEQHRQLLQELNNLKSRQVTNRTTENIGGDVFYEAANTTKANYNVNIQDEINRRVAQSVDRAYRDAYVQRMRQYGYKFKHKKTLKDKLKDLIAVALAIGIAIIVLSIMWQIPSFRNSIESNEVMQIFIRAFIK